MHSAHTASPESYQISHTVYSTGCTAGPRTWNSILHVLGVCIQDVYYTYTPGIPLKKKNEVVRIYMNLTHIYVISFSIFRNLLYLYCVCVQCVSFQGYNCTTVCPVGFCVQFSAENRRRFECVRPSFRIFALSGIIARIQRKA